MHVAGSSGVLVAAKLHHGHATGSRDIQNGWILSGETSVTVLFPCGVGRVASPLLSRLVGLYHKVIYVGGF